MASGLGLIVIECECGHVMIDKDKTQLGFVTNIKGTVAPEMCLS